MTREARVPSGPVTRVEIASAGSNVCSRCGRGLKTPQSVRDGMGRVCLMKAIAEAQRTTDSAEQLGIEGFGGILPIDKQTRDIVLTRIPNSKHPDRRGQPQTNVPWSVVHHSPDGYEWGYSGSGPADLALNILNYFAPPGKDGHEPVKCFKRTCSKTAWMLHQQFKNEFIAVMEEEGGTIPGDEIAEWIETHKREEWL